MVVDKRGYYQKTICTILVTGVVVLIFLIAAVNHMFAISEKQDPFFTECGEVWAHRGYVGGGLSENTIEAFRNAIDRGANGIELDVFYDGRTGEFIVSHDPPFPLQNVEYLKLTDVFSVFNSSTKYWIDFKNLESLSTKATQESLSLMHLNAKKYSVEDLIIIESLDAPRLAIASKLGLLTSYWITFNAEAGVFRYWYHIFRLKIMYLLGYFSVVSMDEKVMSDSLDEALMGVPILLFTINDLEVLHHYLDVNSVRVILTDKPYYREVGATCSKRKTA
jgi:hypothetical protein